jgi:hypothetical protein
MAWMSDDYDGDLFSRPEPEAFEGLSEETVEAIKNPVTPEQVLALVSKLTADPLHVNGLVRRMQQEPWWRGQTTYDTQRRRIRVIRDAAVLSGYPVCSTNAGYFIGDWAGVLASARRCRRSAEGDLKRAVQLEQLAERMIQ